MAIRVLARSLLAVTAPKSFSTSPSPSPSNLREILRIQRILPNPNPPDHKPASQILQSFGLGPNSEAFLSQLGKDPSSFAQKLLEQQPGALRHSIAAMKDLGLEEGTLIRAIAELPLATFKDFGEIRSTVQFLKGFGLDAEEINRVCSRFPGFLEIGRRGRLQHLFREFRELGFARNEVRKALRDDPRTVLAMDAGETSRCVDLLECLKCRRPIRERILRNGVLRAAVEVKRRVDCLHAHGLIRRDAFKVLFVEPRVILYELGDVERKIAFLVHELGFCIEHLVQYPEFLGINLDKQIVPRHNVILHLRSIGGLGDPVEMKHFVRLSRLKFYNLFVKPYPECEKIFGGVVREKEVRPRHPAGLWKLFKPQKCSPTEEDVKNIRLLMESLT